MKPQINTLNDIRRQVPQSQFTQALILAILLHGGAILYIDLTPMPIPHPTPPVLMVTLTPPERSQVGHAAHFMPVALSSPLPANQEPSPLGHHPNTTSSTSHNSHPMDQHANRQQALQVQGQSWLLSSAVASVVHQLEQPISKQIRLDGTGQSPSNASTETSHPDSEAENAAQPRRKVISANTTDSRYAAYLEAWRRKVEFIGNLNYPEAARHNNLHGDVILQVTLRANGSVQNTRVVHSSGYQILDEAAIHIVQLAGSFAPFPVEIRQEVDILDITRTWQFLSGNRIN